MQHPSRKESHARPATTTKAPIVQSDVNVELPEYPRYRSRRCGRDAARWSCNSVYPRGRRVRTGGAVDSGEKIGQDHRDLPPELVDGFALGNPDTPLLLTVFEDFQCPFCIRFATTVEPVLIEEFIATGQLRLEFRNFPILGPESGTAAAGSVCAARETGSGTTQVQSSPYRSPLGRSVMNASM